MVMYYNSRLDMIGLQGTRKTLLMIAEGINMVLTSEWIKIGDCN